MTKAIACVILALFLVGTLTMTAAAFGPGPQEGIPNRLAGVLNLTDDQQQKLLVIHQNFQKDTLGVKQKLELTRFELKKLWKAQPLDSSKINAQVKVETDLRIQLVQKRREMSEKAKAVLTPEQLKTLENYRNRKDEMRFKRGRHPYGAFNRMGQAANNTIPAPVQ